MKNIFTDEELDWNSVTKDFLVTAADGKNYRIVNLHLKIFTEGEMDEFSVTEDFSATAEDTSVVQRIVKYYNLDTILVWLMDLKILDNIFTIV